MERNVFKTLLSSSPSSDLDTSLQNVLSKDVQHRTGLNIPWTKLSKTEKIVKLEEYAANYVTKNKLSPVLEFTLIRFLKEKLDQRRLATAKEVVYDQEKSILMDIPLLIYNSETNAFALKRSEKRVSTIKNLTPKKR